MIDIMSELLEDGDVAVSLLQALLGRFEGISPGAIASLQCKHGCKTSGELTIETIRRRRAGRRHPLLVRVSTSDHRGLSTLLNERLRGGDPFQITGDREHIDRLEWSLGQLVCSKVYRDRYEIRSRSRLLYVPGSHMRLLLDERVGVREKREELQKEHGLVYAMKAIHHTHEYKYVPRVEPMWGEPRFPPVPPPEG